MFTDPAGLVIYRETLYQGGGGGGVWAGRPVISQTVAPMNVKF